VQGLLPATKGQAAKGKGGKGGAEDVKGKDGPERAAQKRMRGWD